MIRISDKKDCCGCAACVQRCPKHCISLEEDTEGFLYPKVDTKNCINCGLCEKVCPWQNRLERKPLMKVLAVKNHNEVERMASSSGGVFIALAKEVLSKGGVVFGAAFDENWEVRHTYAETLEAVKPMMGSKYLQSRIENSYQDAEEFLKEGRHVLFTGTPCQIAGLHRFLRKEYPNLLSVDILCHGVPSPKVWQKYLHESVCKVYHIRQSSSFPLADKIANISFRSKEKGWKGFCMSIVYKNQKKEVIPFYNDTYMNVFLSNLSLRPNCYACPAKLYHTQSDITLADFWGIDQLHPEIDDDKGCGLILVHNDHALSLLKSLDCQLQEQDLDEAIAFNPSIIHSVKEPINRNFFYMIFNKINFYLSYQASVSTNIAIRIIRSLYRRL